MTERVGFVGLGNIGAPMAGRLCKPFDTMVLDLNEEAMKPLVEAGAKAASSCREVVEHAEVIGVCVLDDAGTKAVVAGEKGLLEGAKPGTIIMLQPGAGSDAAGKIAKSSGLPVVDYSDVMDDPVGALMLISGLDAYVTVPSIGFQLRLATGGAADLMVPWPADFRLAGTGDSSPWYPQCRLHRAAPGADWQGAFTTLSQALATGA